MAQLYLDLLALICILLIVWGLTRTDRVYQYPFFMGGIFISFVLPQAIALYINPDSVTQKALERVLLMSCLCAASCWLGYQLPTNPNLLKKFDVAIDSNKLFLGGLVLVSIGYISAFLIFQLPEAAKANTQWTGIITIYAFFRRLIYPGLGILLLLTLKRSNMLKLSLTAFAAALPIQLIFFEGRREPTVTFIITIGLSLFYIYKIIPPRWFILSWIIFALLAIPLTGIYRSIAESGDWSQLLELRPIDHLQSYVEQGETLELRNAALMMDAAVQTRQYGYGTDYWNTLIFRFVPAQIVGREIKDFLQIELGPQASTLENLYNYNLKTGVTITGIGDTFLQFDYIGCLFFAFLAYLYKLVWIASTQRNNIFMQLIYISIFSSGLLSVTHGTVRFFPDLLFRLIFIGAVIIYARRKPRKAFNQIYLAEENQE